MRLASLFILVQIASYTPSTAIAEEVKKSAPATDTLTLDDIVMSPSKRPQKLKQSARNVESLQGEALMERQPADVPEAFQESAGVFVQRTNRGAGAPIIRGLIGPQNLIVVDGVRFNTATFRTGPNQYLALLDPHAIRSAEVLLGPSSVLYGSGAMGGVVYINYAAPTLAGSEELTLNGEVGVHLQSADLTDGLSASLHGSVGDFAFLISGSATRFGALRAGGGLMVPNSDYSTGYWQTKLLYAPSESWELSAGYAGMLMRDAGRTDKFGIGEIRFYDNDDHLAYVRLDVNGDSLFRNTRLTASFHQLDEFIDRYNCKRGPDGTVLDRKACEGLDMNTLTKRRNYDDRVTVFGAEGQTQLVTLDDRLNVSVGVDFFHDQVASRRDDAINNGITYGEGEWAFKPKTRGNFSDGSHYTSLGAYLHGDVSVLKDERMELKLNAGTRFSNFAAFAPDVPGVGDVDYSYGGLVFSGGVQLLLGENVNIYTSYAQGFRAPNLQESTVLGDTGSKFEIPNPDLRPERADTVELGTRLSLGDLELSGALFLSLLQDAIDEEATTWEGQSEIDGTPVVRRVNTAEGQSLGTELRLSYSFWRMELTTSFTWITSELTKSDGTTTPSRRTPPIFGGANLRYKHPNSKTYVEVGVRWAGEQDELHPSDKKDLRICETSYLSGVKDPECAGSPAWASLHIRGGMSLTDNLRAELSMANILDTYYKPHGSGMPAPGTDVRFTLRSSF